MTPERRANFQRLLSPRHIAFIGGRDATIAIKEARRRGFQGQMWAVNTKRSELAGLPCVASINDLPEAPDAVYLAIPAGRVVAALQTLAQMGAGGVVCFWRISLAPAFIASSISCTLPPEVKTRIGMCFA